MAAGGHKTNMSADGRQEWACPSGRTLQDERCRTDMSRASRDMSTGHGRTGAQGEYVRAHAPGMDMSPECPEPPEPCPPTASPTKWTLPPAGGYGSLKTRHGQERGSMKITGAVLEEIGRPRPFAESKPISISELDLTAPGPTEILVRLEAAGICHSDLSVVDGNRVRPVPMLLGHEAAGRVVEVGSDVTTWCPDSAWSCPSCRAAKTVRTAPRTAGSPAPPARRATMRAPCCTAPGT